MKFLVTGGAGFIGSHISKILKSLNHEVTALDSLDNNLYSKEIKRLRLAELQSIGVSINESSILNCDDKYFLNFDCIINEAGLPGQLLSWKSFSSYLNANTESVFKILEQIKNSDIRFVQASTSSVYGQNAIGNEDQILKPTSPYGITKLAAEKLILAYEENFGLNYNILRYFSVYGPSQRPDMAIQKFLLKLYRNEIINVTGDGNQLRDFTYVEDVALATISAANSSQNSHIMNISGGAQYSINQIIRICENVVGKTAKIKYIEKPPGDQVETKASCDAARAILNYEPSTHLQDGIREQYLWIKRNI